MKKSRKSCLPAAAVIGGLLLLGGCGQKVNLGEEYTEEVNTLEGVKLIVEQDFVTPKEIQYTVQNQSSVDLSYGQDYSLQKEKEGKWYVLKPDSEVAVTLELLFTLAGYEDTYTLNWESFYGSLPSGHYRLVKSVTDDQRGYIYTGGSGYFSRNRSRDRNQENHQFIGKSTGDIEEQCRIQKRDQNQG